MIGNKRHHAKVSWGRTLPLIGTPLFDELSEDEKLNLFHDFNSKDKETLIKAYTKYKGVLYNNLKRINNEYGRLTDQLSSEEFIKKVGASKLYEDSSFINDALEVSKSTDEDFSDRVRGAFSKEQNEEFDNLTNYYADYFNAIKTVASKDKNSIDLTREEADKRSKKLKYLIPGKSLSRRELRVLRKYNKI